jgi:hypothetical protein
MNPSKEIDILFPDKSGTGMPVISHQHASRITHAKAT